MIGNNRSMRAVLGRWCSWCHQSKYMPLLLVLIDDRKRGHVCRLMTSGTSPAQYGPHRLFIANYEKSLHDCPVSWSIFFLVSSPRKTLSNCLECIEFKLDKLFYINNVTSTFINKAPARDWIIDMHELPQYPYPVQWFNLLHPMCGGVFKP